jgi:hypothetical protein
VRQQQLTLENVSTTLKSAFGVDIVPVSNGMEAKYRVQHAHPCKATTLLKFAKRTFWLQILRLRS